MSHIQTEYEQVRAIIGDNSLITLLSIGHESTTVITGSSGMVFAEQRLTVGSNHVALSYFKHNPPHAR